MQSGRQAFFQRVSASLIVPITLLPLAAILLAAGNQLGIGPLQAAGLALIQTWLPLFFGIGISIGFTDHDAMGALAVVTSYLVMMEVAEAVAGDPTLNLGVLGGIVAGAVGTWIFNKVKGAALPEFLALFSGKRLGPILTAMAGVPLGYLVGFLWPFLHGAIVALGQWMYSAGGLGVFVYGATLRLLIPTGLHHILMQLVDYQIGGWLDPANGKLVVGEYVRFLAGDPQAGRILSGFFLTLGFGPLGAALAITHEARPELRRKVAGLMVTGVLTAFCLGVTEPVEFAFIFASPVLFGLHVLLSGLASWAAYALNIHMGGYALPMVLINWDRQQNAWLLLPLGLAFTAVYYVTFRATIRWLRPPILGQVPEEIVREAVQAEEEGTAFLRALGGPENIAVLTACMTRLRLELQDPATTDDAMLTRLGAVGLLRPGGTSLQVVVGARAGEIAGKIRAAMATARPAATVTLLSPVTGRVVPLSEIPDPVFSEGLAGDGVAVEATEGLIVAPARGTVLHVFPGGHAIGLCTPEGLELLIHIGIDTVKLNGEGFQVAVAAGDVVEAGTVLGQFDPQLVARQGKSLVSPVLVTNPDRIAGLAPLGGSQARAGSPLLQVTLKA